MNFARPVRFFQRQKGGGLLTRPSQKLNVNVEFRRPYVTPTATRTTGTHATASAAAVCQQVRPARATVAHRNRGRYTNQLNQ